MRALNVDDAHEMLVAILIGLAMFGALWAAGSLLGPPKPNREGAAKCDIRAN